MTPPTTHATRRPSRGLARAVRALVATAVVLTVCAVAALEVALRVVPFDPASLESPETSSLLFDRDGRPLRAFLGTDEQWRVPVELDEVSPWLVKAIIAVEDKRFRAHRGVDPLAAARAARANATGRRIVSGASTLTMQVVGLSASRERTVARKLRQAFRALQAERVLSKDRILELYLTYAPYGGNVCGVEAAARRYFNKPASDLNLAEASLLAGVPQSPARFRPDRAPDAALRRRDTVLARMLADGVITRAEHDRARAVRPAVGSFDAPVLAPHFTDLVHAAHPRMTRVRTTLDPAVQAEAERLLRRRVAASAHAGLTNGAVVVIENATGDILAMVGSVSYGAASIQGQVNGATSPRSPGSALKPLVYALAFEHGVILPDTILPDVPVSYAGYRPENFDHSWQGLVRADRAMAWSLNIPAIDLLQMTGLSRAVRFMRDAGLATLNRPPGEYGLSLALGTCAVTLLDLTNAYAMLARGGRYLPPRMVLEGRRIAGPAADAPSTAALAYAGRATPRTLLGPQACHMVARALADPTLRPPEEISLELLGLEGVAWKTGTSSGFRDAWTIACTATHTVGVWLGNFDGRPSPGVTGARAAAPAALGLARWLQKNRGRTDPLWPRRPDGLADAAVCTLTGRPAHADCPTTRATVRIADAPVPASCGVHRRMLVDTETGGVLCPRCMAGRTAEQRVFAVWPPRVSQWFRDQRVEENAPPRHYAGCETARGMAAPRIVSPADGDSFMLLPGRDAAAQKIALRAVAPAASTRLYWFLNGTLLESAAPGDTVFLEPRPGRHRLRCADDLGRAHEIAFSVQSE